MESDKKLETLEEELKLMKGELKQTLASVRDYLLNMELPSSEFATVIAALSGDGSDQKITMKGSFTAPPDSGIGESPKEELPPEESPAEEEPQESLLDEPEEEPASEGTEKDSLAPESELYPEDEELIGGDEPFATESELPPEEELIDQGDNIEPEAELLSEEEEEEAGEPEELEESLAPESLLPAEEEQQMEYERINAEASQSTPKVNLMANLINWTAKAKKEIGYEQMPTFLEVYGISGHLSPELKEVILHLSDITSEQSEDTNTAEIWSQSMLSLHGILTGGNAPVYPIKPYWNGDGSEMQPGEDEATKAEVDKPKDMPLKLKLVFPNGDGKDKEFCIDLNPSTDNDKA